MFQLLIGTLHWNILVYMFVYLLELCIGTFFNILFKCQSREHCTGTIWQCSCLYWSIALEQFVNVPMSVRLLEHCIGTFC